MLKKIIIVLFLTNFLVGCAQNAALLGPDYTLATSGNIYHAGFTYGGNELITKTTGKSATQNLKDMLVPKKDDTEFEQLVKKNIKETRKKLNLSNQ
jgi:hypothetical protein